MKKTIFLIAAGLLAVSLSATEKISTIEKYFYAFNKDELSLGAKKRLISKGKKSGIPYGPVSTAYLDEFNKKTAYIKYSINGEGGGTVHELTYWTRHKKPHLICYNEAVSGMGSVHNSKIRFYEFTNYKKWTEVTEQVFPKLKLKDFSPELENNEKAGILYILPEKGLDIKATYNHWDSTPERTYTLTLKWNKKKGIFTIKK